MSDEAAGERELTRPRGAERFYRSGLGLEFDRISFFCDAVYAIALTLMAVELRPPEIPDAESASDLLHGLREMSGELILFFVVFFIIGSYWVANHRFIGDLRAVSSRFRFALLPYLAFIAFLPFPANLMGTYDDNPVAGSVFAVSMAIVSLLEWVLLQVARADDLLIEPMSPEDFRWASVGSLSPVVLFLVSVSCMFVDPLLGIAVWFLNMPVGILLNRIAPTSSEL